MERPTLIMDRARVESTKRTVKISDAFVRLLCFVCADVLDPNNDKASDVPALHCWIGGSPKFLAVLLCEDHYKKWLAEAYISADAHHWPTTLIHISHQNVPKPRT